MNAHTTHQLSHPLDWLRKPMMPTALLGGALTLVGIVVAAVGITATQIGTSPMVSIGSNLGVIGLGLILYAGLRRKGRSIEEAYRLGYDVGFENGFHSHVEDVIERIEVDGVVEGGTLHAKAKTRRQRRADERRREHRAVTRME